MGRYTLEDLRARAMDLADVPTGAAWLTTARLDDAINDGLAELHDILNNLWQDCLLKVATVPVVAGVDKVTLPSDFFSLREIYILDGDSRTLMEPWQYEDRNGTVASDSSDRPAYRIADQILHLMPEASKALSLEIWYLQAFQRMTDEHQELPAIIPDGWAQFPVAHAAAYLLARREEDPSYPLGMKEQIRARIKSAASMRRGRPRGVQDVSGRFQDFRTRAIAALPRRS